MNRATAPIKGNKIPIRIVLGRVFESDHYMDKCPCGEWVTKRCAADIMSGKVIKDILFGVCKCGNIFRTGELKKILP
jgi:hypothetical protein